MQNREGNGPHPAVRIAPNPLPIASTIFTIIIPVKAVNDYVRETISHILRLKDPAWELIIVPNEDTPSEWHDQRVRLISSGRVGPAAKRDRAAKMAQGEILVFLDDDSYPREDLLTAVRPFFSDLQVAAVGGPAITPPEDGFWQRVSGAVFLSRFSGGSPERYLPVGDVREVHDWPSVNLMVRKTDFLSVGGFAAVAGILYMVFLGRRSLPDRCPMEEVERQHKIREDLAGIYRLKERLQAAQVHDGSPLIGQSLAQSGIGDRLGLTVIAIEQRARHGSHRVLVKRIAIGVERPRHHVHALHAVAGAEADPALD